MERRFASFEQGWSELQEEDMLNCGINTGQQKLFTDEEKNVNYKTCFDMCGRSRVEERDCRLYRRHGDTIKNYLTRTVLPALCEKKGQDGTILFLTELQFRWTNHQIMNKWLKSFFAYLDRSVVRGAVVGSKPLPTLLQVGLLSFRTHIFDAVKQETTTAIIGLINDEREGKTIDKTLVKSIVKLYVNMGMGSIDVYNTDLEEALLTSTREYYAKKRKHWIKNDSSLDDYSAKAEAALREERNRVADYLNASSKEKILKAVEEVLLEKEPSGSRLCFSEEDTLPTAGNNKRKHQGAQPEAELRYCARQGNLDRMRELVLDQRVPVNCTDKGGQTPLIYAAAGKKAHAAQFLLENGATVDAADRYGNTALTFAILRNSATLVQLLLENGASPPRSIGRLFPPLAWATRRGSDQISSLLLQVVGDGRGVDVNAFTPRTGTSPAMSPICEACQRNNLEVVRLLVEKGAQVVYNGVFPHSPCPLVHAVEKGSLELVRFLVENGADVNEQPFLCEMAKEGWSEKARFLLQAGSNVDQQADNDNGKTPLWIAAEHGNVTLVKELLGAGADPSICDYGGDAPLVVAHSREHTEVEYLLIRQSPLDWLGILLRGLPV